MPGAAALASDAMKASTTKLARSRKRRWPGVSELRVYRELWAHGFFSLGPVAAAREADRAAGDIARRRGG